MRRAIAAVVLAGLLAPASVSAQNMNIALSRLRIADSGTDRDFRLDETAWRQVMTQFGGSMMPPILTGAGTRGVRGIYVGFETWLTGIDNSEEYWHRAVEGDGTDYDPGNPRSRFVDSVLAWGRFNVRKGLPFGFELGTHVGYMANSTYWTLGLEVRWALFEGFRMDVGWIPDVAVRAAVETLVGDGEFNVTVPSFDIILSEPFVVANSIEITPSIYGQFAWVFADSELVDLTPETGAFEDCDPNPATPVPSDPPPTSPYCRMGGRELNHNVVFPAIRSQRIRLGGGLQLRYEWFTVLGSFVMDVVNPSQLDSSLPADLPAQWQVDLGVGLTF